MKLIWGSLLAVLLAGSWAAVDVEKTVKQVQRILLANQELPRLTRDEIIQLLNDIRSEDAKESKGNNIKAKETTSPVSVENETSLQEANIRDNLVSDEKDFISSTAPSKDIIESTTKSAPKIMVVLPYTPRDGSSLQELYTRPPRVEVVRELSTTSRPRTEKRTKSQLANFKDDSKLPPELIDNFPAELQAFLDAHGLKGKPGQDSFLLPLEGFKPLPPVKVIDETVELPENLLLTYDLIAPSSISSTAHTDGTYALSPNNFLYEPLRPELPFELDTSSSETKHVILPYDLPTRNMKSISMSDQNPIDYDSMKVIPLDKGISPVKEEVLSTNDQSKRQVSTEESDTNTEKLEITTTTTTSAPTTTTDEPKTNVVSDSIPADADTDTGASIADLEESFGGAAPSKPGDSQLPPPKKNGFYWMLDWNSFLEVGDGDTKVNIRFEPKLGDPQMFLPVTVP